MEWIDKNFVKLMIGLCLVLIIGYAISEYVHHKQLVEDYMIEYKLDKKAAERRIRIDQNSGKKIYYNNSTNTTMIK